MIITDNVVTYWKFQLQASQLSHTECSQRVGDVLTHIAFAMLSECTSCASLSHPSCIIENSDILCTLLAGCVANLNLIVIRSKIQFYMEFVCLWLVVVRTIRLFYIRVLISNKVDNNYPILEDNNLWVWVVAHHLWFHV